MGNSSVRLFTITKDSSGFNHITVRISETPGLQAENLSLLTWGSSFILANQLHRWKEDAQVAINDEAVSVLELGAGTSLVGISAAAIWALPVIVTDLQPLIAGLEQNVLVNNELLDSANASVRCGVLDWSMPSNITLSNPADTIASSRKANIILAADTVYAEDHPQLLSDTVSAWLSRSTSARVILCYVLRHAYIDIIRELWTNFEDIGLECLEEGRQDADPDLWDDVAPFEWCVWRWKQSQ